jgi:hypothetical protein
MNVNHYTPNRTQYCFDLNYPQVNDRYKNLGVINWWWLSEEEAQLENLKNFVESQDICFFVSEEIFDRHHSVNMNKVFELLNSYNVYYILFSCDAALDVQPSYNRSFYNPWFFKSPLYVPSNFEPNIDFVEKKYAFNLMLGSNKPYRTLAYKVLKENTNIYSKYLGHPNFKIDSVPSLDEDEVTNNLISQDVAQHKLNTMNFVKKQRSEYPISHVVPEKIYANTHFDIVTETFIKHQTMFITEKTAKPLATGRFFCWYNSYNVASYLEPYGFDFTHYNALYDKMCNDVDRLDAMLELVEEIASNPLFIKDIYEKSKSARIHNMEVFKQHTQNFDDSLNKWITSCLNI